MRFAEKLTGIKLPESWSPILALIGAFLYRDYLLDAWVKEHITTVREKFKKKYGEEKLEPDSRRLVSYDGEPDRPLTPDALQRLFEKKRIRLLIHGKAALVRTRLACQIANMGMTEDKKMRLCRKHLLIPILLERGTNYADNGSPHPLLETISSKLHDMTEADIISEELVKHLLKRKRILVIIDGLSEFARETRSQIKLEDTSRLPSILAVTSKAEDEAFSKTCIIRTDPSTGL